MTETEGSHQAVGLTLMQNDQQSYSKYLVTMLSSDLVLFSVLVFILFLAEMSHMVERNMQENIAGSYKQADHRTMILS